jgi:hypothetical protein
LYISASLGGSLFGGGFAYYYAQKFTEERLANWDFNWDKLQYLTEEEEIAD